MSETLENSVREMLKAETWTRAGYIANSMATPHVSVIPNLIAVHAPAPAAAKQI